VVAKLDDSTAIVFGGWSWLEMGDVHFVRLVGCNDVETGPNGSRTRGVNRVEGFERLMLPFCQVYKGWIIRCTLGTFGLAMIACLAAWCIKISSW